MKVYLVLESCCNHFEGLYKTREDAEAYVDGDEDYEVIEIDLSE